VTVLQYWQQQLTIAQAEQAAAQSDLAAAQARLATASKKANGDPAAAPGPLRDGDQKTLANTAAAIAAKRAELASEISPPDAAALVDEITALIITQRTQHGTLLDDLDEIAAAQAAIDAAAGMHSRASARIAVIQSAIADATSAEQRRAALKTAIATAPLSTMKADAAAFLAGSVVTNATTRMGKNFPTELLAIGDKRHDLRVARIKGRQTSVQNAEDALGNEYAADAGLSGKALQKRIAFDRAQAALASYVATAATRYKRAETIMAMLDAIEAAPAGAVADVLTDAEKAELAALATAGAAAEPAAEALDTDLGAVFTAETALDAQILTAIAADPDTVDTDATVAAKKAAITAAQGTFAANLAAFAAGDKPDLDRWQAAVPDTAWQLFLDYQDALDALTDLSGSDPAALATAMDNAEADYVTALQAAAVAERKVARLAGAIVLRQERLESLQGTLTARMPSAVRGDSY
jgi:trimeric autotransporter adhesin